METPTPGQPTQQFQQPYQGLPPVPNSTTVLVLGILSIVFCWCYGLIGLILGIIAIVLANKARALDAANPGMFSEGSRKNLNAGRICAIIGTCLSSLYVLFIIIYVMIIGAALTTLPWGNM